MELGAAEARRCGLAALPPPAAPKPQIVNFRTTLSGVLGLVVDPRHGALLPLDNSSLMLWPPPHTAASIA
eukprot:scaffold35308_cov32-Tisochrysis_lutea.AAC.5